jgi:hypothetical protein
MRHFNKVIKLMVIVIALLISVDLWFLQGSGSTVRAYPPPGYSTSAPLYDNKLYIPLAGSIYYPPATVSYYITHIEPALVYNLGYNLGTHDRMTSGPQDNLVILDYGYPYKQDGQFGVKLVYDRTYTFYSTDQIRPSAVAFGQGYYDGTRAGAAQDTTSSLRIVIGVNNCCYSVLPSVFPDHGRAWALMVNGINADLRNYHQQTQVYAVGGSDIQQDSNYGGNDPYTTRTWVDGYTINSDCAPVSDTSAKGCFYNFGNITFSISGTICHLSRQNVPTPTPVYWNGCDMWYGSWGVKKGADTKHFARPLPEIYVNYNPLYPQYPWGQNATAWKDLSLFSAMQMNAGKMYFAGSLTQRAECGNNCGAGNNYPWEGYTLLYRALASDPTTSMGLWWLTDIQTQQ